MNAPSAGARPYAATAAALTGCFLASYHTRFIGIGLPDLRGAFGLSVDEASWLATAATAPQICLAPAVPWLVMVFGLRPVLLWPGLAYAALVGVIPLLRDVTTLFALHAACGFLLGLFVPATMLVIVRNLPPVLWLPAFAIYAFRLAFSLNTGPALVGYFVQEAGWPWLYWADVPVALLMAWLAAVGSTRAPVDRALLRQADWGGMILFGSGLMLIYVGLDQGNRLDWGRSGTVVILLSGGAALMMAFALHEAVTPRPWAAPQVLFQWNTIFGLSSGIVFSLVAVSNSVLVPNFLLNVAQLRPEQIGWPLFETIGIPLIGWAALGVLLLRRVDFRLVMILGFASFAAASLWATRLTAAWRMDDFTPVALLQSAGLGLTFTAVMVGNFTSIRPENAAAFSAYIQILRLIAVEFGVVAMATFIRVREQTHSHLLGLHVALGDPQVARSLGARISHLAADGEALARRRAFGVLASSVQREANVQAFIDGFAMTFVLALLGIILAGMMRRAPGGPLTTI